MAGSRGNESAEYNKEVNTYECAEEGQRMTRMSTQRSALRTMPRRAQRKIHSTPKTMRRMREQRTIQMAQRRTTMRITQRMAHSQTKKKKWTRLWQEGHSVATCEV